MAHKSNKKIRTLYAEKAAATEKPEKKESQGKLLVDGIAAAVEKSMTTAFSKVQKEQGDVNKKILSTLESISASQTELVSGLHELALGKLEAAVEEPEEQEEEVELDAAGDATVADATMASARRKKADATDSTDATQADATADDASDATDAQAAAVEADATDPTNFTSSDQGENSTPGDLNPKMPARAHSNARQGSTQLTPGGGKSNPGIAASARRGTVAQISAAAKMIGSLRAENANLREQNSRQQNRISAIEASLERYADRVERRSVTPEISALLEKSGYDVRELMSTKQRLSVHDVDQMFASSGVPLEPQMRAAFKNQLLQLGLMETGEVRRFAN